LSVRAKRGVGGATGNPAGGATGNPAGGATGNPAGGATGNPAGGAKSSTTSISVSIVPQSAILAPNASVNLVSYVSGTSNTAVTWSVQEANGGQVDQSGKYTAPTTEGTYHVIAQSVADTKKTGTSVISVSKSGNLATVVKYSSRQEVIDPWPYGSPAIVRDKLGNHDFLHMSLNGSQLMLYRSANWMATATEVTKSGTISLVNKGPISMAQDSEGNLHLITADGGSTVWSKVILTRTNGSVTGWTLSPPIKLPGDYGVSDFRLECRTGTTSGGEESVFFMATSAATAQACQVIIFRSKINPTSTADFVKLTDGKPGYDVVYTTQTASDTAHTYGGHFAQIGSNSEILCAFGPINVGHGGAELHHSFTRVLKPNGTGTWSIGGLIDRGSNNGVARQLLYGTYGTPNAAWVMWQDPDHGVRFDSYSSAGAYKERAVPEPDANVNYNGVGTFSVSSSNKIYASYLLFDNAMNPKGVYWAFYDGAAWKTTFDFTQSDFSGMHGSVDWDGGLASIYVPDPPSTQYIGSIYSVP
jgi:hypothetical protein